MSGSVWFFVAQGGNRGRPYLPRVWGMVIEAGIGRGSTLNCFWNIGTGWRRVFLPHWLSHFSETCCYISSIIAQQDGAACGWVNNIYFKDWYRKGPRIPNIDITHTRNRRRAIALAIWRLVNKQRPWTNSTTTALTVNLDSITSILVFRCVHGQAPSTCQTLSI